jgi:hypothetical protein
MSTYLADELRAIAASPTDAAIDRLPALAVQVERLERYLDDMVGEAAFMARVATTGTRRLRMVAN